MITLTDEQEAAVRMAREKVKEMLG